MLEALLEGLLEALLFSGLIALLEPHFAIELLSLANTTLGVGLLAPG